MIRLFFVVCLVGFYYSASAQSTAPSNAVSAQQSLSSVESEACARDEAFAQWKIRYAENRAKIADEIKAVRQEISQLDPTKANLKRELTDLLNGTIRHWNQIKTDYADPEQLAECQALFTTLRTAMREGKL